MIWIESFVNGVYTSDEGAHVNSVYKKIRTYLKSKDINMKIRDIKKDLTIFVSCWVDFPRFGNQIKSCLIKPIPVYEIPVEKMETILPWYGNYIDEKITELNDKLIKLNELDEIIEKPDDSYCIIS